VTSILEMVENRERYLVDRIALLEAEVEDWRKKYDELLTGTIKHNDHMFGLLLKGALDGAFRSPTGPESK
jgi:phage terminase large subunit GpA-like protein